MSHIHQYYLSVIAVLLLSGTATAKQTIKVGYIEFPPAFYTDKTGQANGILIKLTDKVMKKSGYSWTAHSYPTKRMAHYIATGELHLWVGLTTLPEFKGTTLIGPSKLLEISLQSYFIGKKPPINSKEDLKNKKIISVLGYSYGGLTNFIKDPNNKIINYETSSQESAFKMLKAGRADYLLTYKGPATKVLTRLEISDLNQSNISKYGVYFVVSKMTPNAEIILKDLEQAYQSIRKEGTP